MRTKLPTWGAWKNKSKQTNNIDDWRRSSEFEYEGSVKEGTTIYYGDLTKKPINKPILVSKEEYEKLFLAFKNMKEPIILGTSQSIPPEGSVGYWLVRNVSDANGTQIASYVGSILIHEKYAIKGEDPATIEFL
jgi:hypothetical protein